MIKKFISLIAFFFFSTNLTFGQNIWEKVEQRNPVLDFRVEDILLRHNGEIYLSIKGRDLYYRSIDSGLNWEPIASKTKDYYNGGKFNQFEQNKEFLSVSKDSFIIQGSYISGYWWLLQFVADTICPDTSFFNKIFYAKRRNEVFYDNNFNIFWKAGRQVFRINRYGYADYTLIYDAKEYGGLTNFFLYNDTLSYFIENTLGRSRHRVMKYNNHSGEKTELLFIISTLNEPYRMEHTLVTKNGNIFIGEDRGLFIKHHKEVQLRPFNFMPGSGIRNGRVDFIGLSLNRDFIIAKIEDQLIVSYDQGDTWLKLVSQSNMLPTLSSEIKIQALDTNLIIMQGAQYDCSSTETHIYSDRLGTWSSIDLNLSAYDIRAIRGLKSEGVIYAGINESCKFYESKNEGEDWHELRLFDSLYVTGVWNPRDHILLVRASDARLYYSEDAGKNWKPALIDGSTDPRRIQYVYKLFDRTALMVDKLGDKICIFITHDDGQNWYLQNDCRDINGLDLHRGYTWSEADKKIIGHTLTSKDIISSVDLGKSFDLDPKFDEFRSAYSLVPLDDGSYLIGGSTKTLGSGLFRLESNGQINEVSPATFHRYPVFVERMKGPYLVAYSNPALLQLSEDEGKTWKEIRTGINDTLENIEIYTSIWIDKDFYGFLGVNYDGLYKTTQPLVSIYDPGHSDHFKIWPNPVRDVLHFKLPETVKIDQLSISDATGRQISLPKWTQSQLSVSGLPPGPYVLTMRDRHGNDFSEVFLKIGED